MSLILDHGGGNADAYFLVFRPQLSSLISGLAVEVAATLAGIFVDVIGAGLELLPQDSVECLCGVVRRKPATTYDNSLRDIGTRYVKVSPVETFLVGLIGVDMIR